MIIDILFCFLSLFLAIFFQMSFFGLLSFIAKQTPRLENTNLMTRVLWCRVITRLCITPCCVIRFSVEGFEKTSKPYRGVNAINRTVTMFYREIGYLPVISYIQRYYNGLLFFWTKTKSRTTMDDTKASRVYNILLSSCTNIASRVFETNTRELRPYYPNYTTIT